jgi:hypothetical protein
VEKTEVLTRGGAEPEEEIRGGGGCSPPAARFLSPFSLSRRRRRTTNRGEKRKKGQEALLLLRSIGLGPAPARTNGRRALAWAPLGRWVALMREKQDRFRERKKADVGVNKCCCCYSPCSMGPTGRFMLSLCFNKSGSWERWNKKYRNRKKCKSRVDYKLQSYRNLEHSKYFNGML